MKATSVKRLALLIVMLGLFAGTAISAQRFQVTKMARSELAKADDAVNNGDLARAEKLFDELLSVFPDDVEIQIKYADAILKLPQSQKNQSVALGIYDNVLKRELGRHDVRRKRVDLKIQMGLYWSHLGAEDGANTDLNILLRISPKDAHLHFLMGRCYEHVADDAAGVKKAAESYQQAILLDAPERIEASERLAALHRDRLDQPKEAEKIIDKLVADAPGDFRVYLVRGRWRLALASRNPSAKSTTAEIRADFENARRLAPAEPEAYLRLADICARQHRPNYGEAKRILEDGLKHAPDFDSLYTALANIHRLSGRLDAAIEVLEDGLKSRANPTPVRWYLAEIFARAGETGRLRAQIDELKKLGCAEVFIQYFNALYHLNAKEIRQASQPINSLLRVVDRLSDVNFKSKVYELLARYYSESGDPEARQRALRELLIANPNNVSAKLAWIETLISQGDTDGAIREYRNLAETLPEVRTVLARLLIAQNQRRPKSKRDWSEVKKLVEQLRQETPEALEPMILNAQVLLAQGKQAAGISELETAQLRFPKNVEIRATLAQFLGLAGRVDDALSLLDRSREQLGDLFGLRLARAMILALKNGPQIQKDLMDLSQNVQSFSKPDRKRLLNSVAIELLRLQDLNGAGRLWTRLADEDPTDIEIRLQLVDLALRRANEGDVEKYINQIEAIEGSQGLLARHIRVRYLIWQAKRALDKDTRESIQSKAHLLLDDLASRRGEWSVIPLDRAQLAEQELSQGDLEGDEKRAKEDAIIGLYLRAIKLGHRNVSIVNRVVYLLLKNGRGNDALELLGNIPIETQLAGDVERGAAQLAFDNKEFEQAERFARKAIESNPDDIQARLWLARILLARDRQAEAESGLREWVALSPADPDRWITLVSFLINVTKQPEKAAAVIREAEAKLPPAQAPLALAQCCENMTRAFEVMGADAKERTWNDAARKWFGKAEVAHPDDLSIKRRLAEFFIRSKQFKEAEQWLQALLRQGDRASSAEIVAWARQTLARLIGGGPGRTRLNEALALFEPGGEPAPPGEEGMSLTRSDDLRVLAGLLGSQRSILYRKRAIAILETLALKNLACSNDQFLLAGLYESIDDWPRAREEYQELNLRTRDLRDDETLRHRPLYLAQFTRFLLAHREPGDDKDLAQAQELVDELRRREPDALVTLTLRVEILRARNEIDQAAEQVDRALEICEPLLTNVRDAKSVLSQCVVIIFGSDGRSRKAELAQIDRVAGWFVQAIAQAQKQKQPVPELLFSYGTLRERQGRYREAQDLYLQAVQEGGRDGFAYNGLAWLSLLHDKKVKVALEYANLAVDIQSDHPEFLDTRAMVHLANGNPKLALIDLQKAVEIDPSSAAKHFHLAQAYLANNEIESARQNFEAANKLGFTPNSLHDLEQPNLTNVLQKLRLIPR